MNVFLPLKTDAKGLFHAIQKYVKPVKDPHLTKSCGLTTTSRMNLGAELQQRLNELRRDLNAEQQPMDSICNAFHLFQYFATYVPVEDVRNAFSQADTIFQDFIQLQLSILIKGVEQVTSANQNFGKADAASMKEAFARLQTIESACPNLINTKNIQLQIDEKLQAFCNKLHMDIASELTLEGMHANLDKLASWSIEFPAQAPFYENLKNQFTGKLNKSVARMKSFNIDEVLLNCGLCESDFEAFIQNLETLKSIHDDNDYLVQHGIDTKVAYQVFQTALERIEQYISHVKQMVETVVVQHYVDSVKINDLAQATVNIDCIARSFDKVSGYHEVKETLQELRKSTAYNINELFENYTSQVKQNLDHSHSTQKIQPILENMKIVSENLYGTGNGLFLPLGVTYSRLVDYVKIHITQKGRQMKQVVQDVGKWGITDGNQYAEELVQFKVWCWFDQFLSSDMRFVENMSKWFELVFIDRIRKVYNEAQVQMNQIKDEFNSETPVNALKLTFTELGQVSLFLERASVKDVGDLRENENKVRDQYLNIIESFVKDSQDCIIRWKQLSLSNTITNQEKHQLTHLNKKMNRILEESKLLAGLDSHSDDMLSNIHDCVVRSCKEASDFSRAIMMDRGKYEEKLNHLLLAQSRQKYKLIIEYMLPIDKLQLFARNSVASDAKEIEDLVSQSSEWEKIDNHLTKFEKASVMDEFINNEVSSRISPLLKLREQKQEEVDNLLDQMIIDQDFSNIGGYLEP